MNGYWIGFNIVKQLLFGVGYCMGSWSLCFACFSIKIHPRNRKTGDKFSFFNEFSNEND